VHLMGGRVWVESEVGRGSIFHFTAGFGLVDSSPGVPATSDAIDLQGLSVLVVDDNTTNRRLLEEILLGWHMRPSLSAEATEALAALRIAQESGTPFPLVLTDFQMPGIYGFA